MICRNNLNYNNCSLTTICSTKHKPAVNTSICLISTILRTKHSMLCKCLSNHNLHITHHFTLCCAHCHASTILHKALISQSLCWSTLCTLPHKHTQTVPHKHNSAHITQHKHNNSLKPQNLLQKAQSADYIHNLAFSVLTEDCYTSQKNMLSKPFIYPL